MSMYVQAQPSSFMSLSHIKYVIICVGVSRVTYAQQPKMLTCYTKINDENRGKFSRSLVKTIFLSNGGKNKVFIQRTLAFTGYHHTAMRYNVAILFSYIIYKAMRYTKRFAFQAEKCVFT